MDLARHGPRAGLTIDVWVLDGWSAVSALSETGQLEEVQQPSHSSEHNNTWASSEQRERGKRFSEGSLNSTEDGASAEPVTAGDFAPTRPGPYAQDATDASMLWETFQ
eukprot:COSAG02_NODE_25048_length_670_cov_0.845884_1_plen_107_part_01